MNRTDILNYLGLKVVRFENEEVEENIEKVIELIKKEIKELYPFSCKVQGMSSEN
jgi:very-short-patch-repair endonuclease